MADGHTGGRWRPMIVLGALAGVLGWSGCRNVAGLDGLTPVENPGVACRACAEAHCRELVDACFGDEECEAYASCLMSCGPNMPVCRSDCFLAHRAGYDADPRLDQCLRADCEAECIGTRSYYGWLGAECEACVQDACGDDLAACRGEAQCDAAYACAGVASDPSQKWGCSTAVLDPDGDAECARLPDDFVDSPVGLCRTRSCGVPCQTNDNYACLDDYEWRWSPGPQTRWHRVMELTSAGWGDSPMPGLQIRACEVGDVACAAPVAGPVESDDDGEMCLTIDGGVTGFRGYLELVDPADGFTFLYTLRDPITTSTGELRVPFPIASVKAFYDPLLAEGRGLIGIVMYDCLDTTGENVRFELEPNPGDALQTYLRGGTLDFKADRTDRSGTGGFVNVAPSSTPYIVRAIHADTGQVLAERAVPVRGGAFTSVSLWVRPSGVVGL